MIFDVIPVDVRALDGETLATKIGRIAFEIPKLHERLAVVHQGLSTEAQGKLQTIADNKLMPSYGGMKWHLVQTGSASRVNTECEIARVQPLRSCCCFGNLVSFLAKSLAALIKTSSLVRLHVVPVTNHFS